MSKLMQSLLLIILVVISALSCVFIVVEAKQAVVVRFGKINSDPSNKVIVYKPGLHFKMPFIDEVREFDMRLNILDIKKSRVTTSEKKDVSVDYFVIWQINNLKLFYDSTQGGKEAKAMALLLDKAVFNVKSEFGRLTIKDVVSEGRTKLMERICKNTDKSAQNLGVTVVDVRIKKIELPEEVNDSVYHRMRAERQRKANSLRADGEKAAISLRADADKKRRVIIAEAEKEAETIHGEGDTKAIAIYANAYNKAPEFYEFLRSIEAYKNTFKNKNDILVLKPDSYFFKYFRNIE